MNRNISRIEAVNGTEMLLLEDGRCDVTNLETGSPESVEVSMRALNPFIGAFVAAAV